jgi:hypothetical protein
MTYGTKFKAQKDFVYLILSPLYRAVPQKRASAEEKIKICGKLKFWIQKKIEPNKNILL